MPGPMHPHPTPVRSLAVVLTMVGCAVGNGFPDATGVDVSIAADTPSDAPSVTATDTATDAAMEAATDATMDAATTEAAVTDALVDDAVTADEAPTDAADAAVDVPASLMDVVTDAGMDRGLWRSPRSDVYARGYASVRQLWRADVSGRLHLECLRGFARMLAGRDANRALRQLRVGDGDVHIELHVGRRRGVYGLGSVCAGSNANRLVRSVQRAGVHEQLYVGSVYAATGQRLQLRERQEPPRLLGVPVRLPVLPGYVSMEHGVRVVLHFVRRMSDTVTARRASQGITRL